MVCTGINITLLELLLSYSALLWLKRVKYSVWFELNYMFNYLFF